MMLTLLLFCGGAGAKEVPAVSAASVVLMDADSGRVLYGHGEDEPRLIASTTKLMTALVALESGRGLEEKVVIREEWTGIEGSSLYLRPGEEIRFETLLYGLLLRSGNDAAHAVAGYCAGSVEAFVERMNEKAAQLGMTNTHFDNPSGLNAQGHYSTARDMAVLARACLENESLCKIASTTSITLENRVITNHNKLLHRYEGCIGLKTGYTERAGRTLVSAARREGMTLICVTLNAPDDWRDHTALFDYGFETYVRRRLVSAGDLVCRMPVSGSLLPVCSLRAPRDIWAALKRDEKPEMTLISREEKIYAPIGEQTQLAEAIFRVNGEEIGRLSLRAQGGISLDAAPERRGLFGLFGR